MEKQILLMDRPRIERTLKRMALQVWERMGEENEEELVLIGLNERGYATAVEIASYLEVQTDSKINSHRYDVHRKNPNNTLPDCNEKFVLIVDDVIFSGKTMFSALSSICSIYEPSSIEIATIIDRGHRKYPLRTDLTGITVPTKAGEHIEVMLAQGKLNEAILFKNI